MGVAIEGVTTLLQVFDMQAALHFYRDLLGFEVVEDSGKGDESSWVWLRLNDVNLMLNDQYEPGSRPPEPLLERTVWHGDTCLYFRCPDVDAAYEFLVSKDMDIKPPEIAPYGMKQLYFRDPDGYNLCFQWPADSK